MGLVKGWKGRPRSVGQDREPGDRPSGAQSLNFAKDAEAIHKAHRYRHLKWCIYIFVKRRSPLPGCKPREEKDCPSRSQLFPQHFTPRLAQAQSLTTMFWRQAGWQVDRLSWFFGHEWELSPHSDFCQHPCSYSFSFTHTRWYITFHFTTLFTSKMWLSRVQRLGCESKQAFVLRRGGLHRQRLPSFPFSRLRHLCSFFCHLSWSGWDLFCLL